MQEEINKLKKKFFSQKEPEHKRFGKFSAHPYCKKMRKRVWEKTPKV